MNPRRSLVQYQHRWLPASEHPESAETLLLLHGTGGDENDLLPLARGVAPRANVLSPRGNVLENGMPRFFRRHAEGVLDVEDLKKRAHELADFVDEAAKEYAFDASRVTALGYSNGANVALGLLFERPATLARAVLARAMMAYEPADGAARTLSGKRALLLAGERDPYSERSMTERIASVLRAKGASVDVRYARAGHELTQVDVEAARAWLT